MKTVLLSAIALIITVGLSSCEKEYTCVCTTSFFNSQTEESTIKARSKESAHNRCISKADLAANLSGKSCDLK